MKHLKTYENPTPYKFKIGDYIRVDSIIKRIKDHIYIIRDRYKNDDINNYKIENTDDMIDFWEYESNLIPLSKKEIKLLKDINKYNL